jgi:betaine-aldehyde dehydrogenase
MASLPEQPFQYQLFIDGRWDDARSGQRFDRRSPAHDVIVGQYALADTTDADAAVASARHAFDNGPWPRMKGVERSRIIHGVAEAIREQTDELALIETLESGKPIAQARDEMAATADLWEYAATLSRHVYGDTYNTLGEDTLGLIFREPLGVVAMITPWNFPLLIISQKLPFALAVGCTAVVKPSELTPGTTLQLGRILQEVGLPDGVVNILSGFGVPVGSHLAAHTDVDMISFTGSTEVGKLIVEASRSNLKKVELELGGKNPQLVFADADLEAALDAVVFGVYFNQGECCVSGSRLLVQRNIADEFVARVLERARTVSVGDPLDERIKVGAIVDDDQLGKIMAYIAAGQREGAQLLLGGSRMSTASGRFVEPTVFNGVHPGMSIAREEIFGPVLSVLTFDTVAEAIEMANNTMYGLSSSVWTRDLDTAFQAIRGIKAGTVWVNTYLEDFPELSFGGYKESGLGREIGRFAIEEFTQLKTIKLHLGPRTNWWLQRE